MASLCASEDEASPPAPPPSPQLIPLSHTPPTPPFTQLNQLRPTCPSSWGLPPGLIRRCPLSPGLAGHLLWPRLSFLCSCAPNLCPCHVCPSSAPGGGPVVSPVTPQPTEWLRAPTRNTTCSPPASLSCSMTCPRENLRAPIFLSVHILKYFLTCSPFLFSSPRLALRRPRSCHLRLLLSPLVPWMGLCICAVSASPDVSSRRPRLSPQTTP